MTDTSEDDIEQYFVRQAKKHKMPEAKFELKTGWPDRIIQTKYGLRLVEFKKNTETPLRGNQVTAFALFNNLCPDTCILIRSKDEVRAFFKAFS